MDMLEAEKLSDFKIMGEVHTQMTKEGNYGAVMIKNSSQSEIYV